jgi:hypothetical protein
MRRRQCLPAGCASGRQVSSGNCLPSAEHPAVRLSQDSNICSTNLTDDVVHQRYIMNKWKGVSFVRGPFIGGRSQN